MTPSHIRWEDKSRLTPKGQLQNAAPLRELGDVRRVLMFPLRTEISELEAASNGRGIR